MLIDGTSRSTNEEYKSSLVKFLEPDPMRSSETNRREREQSCRGLVVGSVASRRPPPGWTASCGNLKDQNEMVSMFSESLERDWTHRQSC